MFQETKSEFQGHAFDSDLHTSRGTHVSPPSRTSKQQGSHVCVIGRPRTAVL